MVLWFCRKTQVLVLFVVTAADIVLVGGPKKKPRTSSIVQFMFLFWSFEISENILRNQKILYPCILNRFSLLGPHLDCLTAFLHYVNVSVLIKFSQNTNVFTLFIIRSQ